jgi:antitoxin VapB
VVSLNIKDDEVYRLAQELATANESSMTAEIREALKERQAKMKRSEHPHEGMAERIAALSKRSAQRYKGEDRTRDLFGELYDEDGLPK